MLDLDIVLKVNHENSEEYKIKKDFVKINITSEQYLKSITEKDLQKSYDFYEKMNQHYAKTISESYHYIVFQ